MAFLRKQDRRQDEAAAAELENLYASIDRSQVVVEFDLEGRVLKANANFQAAMGYSLGEVVGRHHRTFVKPEAAASPDYDAFWRTLQSGRSIARKVLWVAKGGREVWLQAVCNPVLDKAGRPYKMVEFGTDITVDELARLGRIAGREEAAREQTAVVTGMADGLGRLGQRDLTARIDPGELGRYAKMGEDFNGALESLGQAFAAISEAAGGLRGGADQIASASDDLARRTEQQAAGLEQTAAALDELTATVKGTADNARRASEMVAAARAEAERSGAVVTRAVEAMGLIESSSGKISQIIGVIDEIAFQTNLLALNAGVEAARAGDAGRGFAVVASEVRSLAQRSADAAKEIKALISTSTEQVGQGVNLVGAAGQALQAIGAKVLEIDSLVGDIAGSAQEQSQGLTQINATVNQMDQATQQNAAMVEQTTAAAHAMHGETEALSDIVSTFDLGAAARAARPRLADGASRPRPSPAEALQRKAAAAIGARFASSTR